VYALENLFPRGYSALGDTMLGVLLLRKQSKQTTRRKHFMIGRIISLGAVVLLSLVTSAWAADVAGKWTATVPGAAGQGESTITFVLKADGETLTGTLNNTQAPGDVQISEGKITGDDISFSITRDIGGAQTKVLWKGKISGDEIKFTRTTQAAGGGAGGGRGGAGAAGAGGARGGGAGAATEIVAKRAK
jgi:hypothetical protein